MTENKTYIEKMVVQIEQLTAALAAMTAENSKLKEGIKAFIESEEYGEKVTDIVRMTMTLRKQVLEEEKVRHQTANEVLDAVFQMNGPSRAIAILRKRYNP